MRTLIDRIEELLRSLAAEDEEEREDVLALPVTEETVPARSRAEKREAGDGGTDDRSGGRTAGEILLERPESAAVETETEAEGAQTIGKLWKIGPVWTVRSGSPEIDETQRTSRAGRTAQAEEAPQPPQNGELIWSGLQWAAKGSTAASTAKNARRAGVGQAGLAGLYRQTVQGLRPAAPALPPEQAGRTVRAQEPGSAASLAVDELDRAVRRDSRRYDGGMSIY